MKRKKKEAVDPIERYKRMRAKNAQKNQEANKMGSDAQKLMEELAALRGKKDENFYDDILRKDYQENLYDSQNCPSKKLINVKN